MSRSRSETILLSLADGDTFTARVYERAYADVPQLMIQALNDNDQRGPMVLFEGTFEQLSALHFQIGMALQLSEMERDGVGSEDAARVLAATK